MPSFAEALYSLPVEKLRSIVSRRILDPRKLFSATDKRALVNILAVELNRQHSVSDAMTTCTSRELRLLQMAAHRDSHRGESWERLVETAGGDKTEAPLKRVMNGLEEKGLAFRVGPVVYVPDVVRHMTPASLADLYSINRCLNTYDAPAIRRIMLRIGLGDFVGAKNANIALIQERLLRAAASARYNPPLTDEEQDVIQYLVKMGGSATPVDVANAVLGGKTEDFFRYDWQNRWKQGHERNSVDCLLAMGLLYVVTAGYGYNLHLVLPGDLLRAIHGDESAEYWTEPEPVPAPVDAISGAPRTHQDLIRDLVNMLSFFTTQDAPRTNTGHIHKATLKNIARNLSIPDEDYATFVYATARQAGLAAPEGDRSLYRVTEVGIAWMSLAPAEQMNVLVGAWLGGTVWAEVFDEPLGRSNEYRPQELIIGLRKCCLSLLAEAQSTSPDAFVSIDSIKSCLVYRRPLQLGGSTSLDYGNGYSARVFVEHMLRGALFWLGMVEVAPISVATESDKARIALRLTRNGKLLAGASPQVENEDAVPREEHFIVQANLEVFVPPYLHTYAMYRLMMFTDPPPKGAASTSLHITRDSVRRALDQGETPERILEFLRMYSRTGVPQNVEYLINDVGGKHGHIHVGRAQMYLQVNSPMLLKELQARRELKPYFVRCISETVAILAGDDLEKVLKELRKAGYLPVCDEGRVVTLPANELPSTVAVDESKLKRPATKSKSPADLLDKIAWSSMASEDGKPWNQAVLALEQDLRKPAGAYDNPALIRLMVTNAIATHNVIEMVYRTPGQNAEIARLEACEISGDRVGGYFQTNDNPVTIDLREIQWARLLPDKF